MQPAATAPRNLGTILGVVAVILAAVALVVSVAVPGPVGPAGTNGTDGSNGATGTQGPQGVQGPAGPGSLMTANTTLAKVVIASTCTNYFSINITVPAAGEVLVSGEVMLDLSHTTATRDVAWVTISNTTTGCADDPYLSIFTIAAGEPTDTYWPTIALFHNYTVTAGTYTFYVNGRMTFGQNSGDTFYYGNIYAVFYP